MGNRLTHRPKRRVYPFNFTVFPSGTPPLYNGQIYFTGYDVYNSVNVANNLRGLFVYDPTVNPNQATEVINSTTVQFDPGTVINDSNGQSQTAMLTVLSSTRFYDPRFRRIDRWVRQPVVGQPTNRARSPNWCIPKTLSALTRCG